MRVRMRGAQMADAHVGVYLGCADRCVAEHVLDAAQVRPALEQMGREGVPQIVDPAEPRDARRFLCWPPLFSSLGDCLTYYCGDTVAYIGDGGYRTVRLDRLHEAFTKVATAPVRALDPYPGVRPQLTIWKRTPG